MIEIFRILLVEDNPGDVRLTREALLRGKLIHEIHVVGDGAEALAYLRLEAPFEQAPRPDIILLDLNLPKVNGREVLRSIKEDPLLRSIPVVILTTSTDAEDIRDMYDLHANGYITKPVDMDQFFAVIQKLNSFWMSVVLLPSRRNA